jgi:hypothetical protein
MRPRFKWRPYVLRAYFDTNLLIAENSGKMTHAYRQFLMGHKGDIEARYTTNKGRLPPEMIEGMRAAYSECEPLLSTVPQREEEDIRVGFRREILLACGFTKEEVDKLDLSTIDDEKFQAMVREKLLGAMVNNGARQKVIAQEEVEKYVERGWEVNAVLPNGKVVMRVPSLNYEG